MHTFKAIITNTLKGLEIISEMFLAGCESLKSEITDDKGSNK